MDDILRVQDLIRALEGMPLEAPVMIAVVKYPGEFELSVDPETGDASWDTSSAVEMCPLETGEVYLQGGQVTLCVELVDFEEQSEAHLPGHSSHS